MKTMDRCPFVGCVCTGGYKTENAAGCGYKKTPDSECEQLRDLPDGISPRDWYNEMIVLVAKRQKVGAA